MKWCPSPSIPLDLRLEIFRSASYDVEVDSRIAARRRQSERHLAVTPTAAVTAGGE